MPTSRPTVLAAPALALGVALGLAAGCSGDPAKSGLPTPGPAPVVPAGDWFPLAEGQSWQYRVTNAEGGNLGTVTLVVGKVTKTASETRAEGQRLVQKLGTGSPVGAGGQLEEERSAVSWRKAKDGIYERVESEGAERTLLRLPVKFGASWSYAGLQMEVVDVRELDVGATTYDKALRVRAFEGDRPGYLFFSRDTGVIAWWGRKLKLFGDGPLGLALQDFQKSGASLPTPVPGGSATPGPSASTGAQTPAPSSSRSPGAPTPASSSAPSPGVPTPAPSSSPSPATTPTPSASPVPGVAATKTP